MATHVNGSHHITLSVGSAQEDAEFHVKTLGMRFIKRTVLFDGALPIYHFYYSNADADANSVVTTFPFRQAGWKGRRGTNQTREVLLSVPTGSLNYWEQRLAERGIASEHADVLDTHRLLFRHPTGVEYRMVEVDGDTRRGHAGNGVPDEYSIHGLFGVGIHVTHPENMVEFMEGHMHAGALTEERDRFTALVGEPGQGGAVELVVNRTDDQGTWTYGEGTVHHFAWNVVDLGNQQAIKNEMEGAGYTDISELKDRKYFKSVYVRSPGGSLFELAVTGEEGWTIDESPKELGSRFQLPSQFESRREEIFEQLEHIDV
ncbi:VOC family protein [Lentzea cavernae]|uniref:Glyoxalase n=1 Tax=Lentzea cavernae TaxID=2020703 RepID=A0ABQ3MDH1_9PSEU|nr:VOC family protein [Lentzea cavernae]GHH39347.1 glyoxalase [Lentzea cavernae]